MLFNFNNYMDRLLNDNEHPEKKNMVEAYFRKHPNERGLGLEEQTWYKEYVSKFNVQGIDYEIPGLWASDFDWKLLFKLVAASFSSTYVLDKQRETILFDLKISVENDGNIIYKSVSELLPFQIDRLYEIYVEEQINLQNHFSGALGFEEDVFKSEKREIDLGRKERIVRFEMVARESGMAQNLLREYL